MNSMISRRLHLHWGTKCSGKVMLVWIFRNLSILYLLDTRKMMILLTKFAFFHEKR